MVSSDVWYSSLIKWKPCAGIWLSSQNTAWRISLEYLPGMVNVVISAWKSTDVKTWHVCQSPQIHFYFFYFLYRCLTGNVCKRVQIYKSFHSTSKLPGHSSCLFWCNRQIKATRAQDITIQFVWATKRPELPQKKTQLRLKEKTKVSPNFNGEPHVSYCLKSKLLVKLARILKGYKLNTTSRPLWLQRKNVHIIKLSAAMCSLKGWGLRMHYENWEK